MNLTDKGEYKNYRETGIQNQIQLDQVRFEHNLLAKEMDQDRKISLQTQKYFLYSLWITGFAVVVDILFRLCNK